MDQQPIPPSTFSLRSVAIVATVAALLGLSVPFTWGDHEDPAGEAITAPFVEPVAAHEPALAAEAQAGTGAACVADAKPAADFTLPSLDGKQVKLSAFRGKVVLLNFWATWCGPCKAEIPGFVELQQQYKDDLVVVGPLGRRSRRQGQGVRRSIQGELPDRARAGSRRDPGGLRADLRHPRLVPDQPRREGVQAPSRNCAQGAVRPRDQSPALMTSCSMILAVRC